MNREPWKFSKPKFLYHTEAYFTLWKSSFSVASPPMKILCVDKIRSPKTPNCDHFQTGTQLTEWSTERVLILTSWVRTPWRQDFLPPPSLFAPFCPPRTTSQELAMEPPRQYVIFWTLESLISAVSTPTVVFTILELMSIMMLHTTVAKSKLFQSMRFQTQLKKRHENVEAGSRFNVEDNATRWRLCESSALKKILTNISFTIF